MLRSISQFLIPFFLIPLFLIPTPHASAQSPTTFPISISSTGEPGNGNSTSPSISADGRFVAFASDATNLVPDDTNGISDIFVHDRQTGETTRVSISTNGEQANGRSGSPAISGNGRYVAFESDATNLVPADTNSFPDIFVHDRLTGETRRVSVGINGEQANGLSENVTIAYDGRYLAYQTMASNLLRGNDNGTWDVYIYDNGVTGNVVRASVSSEGVGGNGASYLPRISGDGRFVAYVSESDNLIANDSNQFADVFAYHRVLAQTERVSVGASGYQGDGWSEEPAISTTGRNVVFVSSATLTSGGAAELNVYRRDRQESRTLLLTALPDVTLDFQIALSANGQVMVVHTVTAGGEGELVWRDFQNAGTQTITSGLFETAFDLSENGRAVVFSSGSQIMLWETGQPLIASHVLSGRVTDPLGRSLALVTVADQLGHSTRTDIDGYFWLAGYKHGPVTLTLEKEGYALRPSTFNFQLETDTTGLNFTATPDKPLEEARLDLGMPYKFDRGCPDPYKGCGGPFHGFASGYCTDLILDAYTYGAEFDIQFDLEQDARAHPEHFYRWHDARSTHDMWRFFAYSGQMLPNSAPYAPGDIIFFDWTEDGEIDHVAIASEVDVNGRPTILLDATGKTNYNPSGLAAELEWQDFHERTARGHARWSGAYQPIIPFPAKTQMLQIAASGENINLRLMDSAGGAMSLTENSLSGGRYSNLIWEESASVENPFAHGGQFTAEISNPTGQPAPFRLTIQLVVNGLVLGRAEASGNLPPGFSRSIPIYVTADDTGTLQLTALPSRVPKIRALLNTR